MMLHFKGLHVIYDKDNVSNTMGEVLVKGRTNTAAALPKRKNMPM